LLKKSQSGIAHLARIPIPVRPHVQICTFPSLCLQQSAALSLDRFDARGLGGVSRSLGLGWAWTHLAVVLLDKLVEEAIDLIRLGL
jgi:hypothetical protein